MENVYIHDNVGIGPNALFATPNASIKIKARCAIAEHLTVHTGNHARVIGKYITDIREDNKPEGYDSDQCRVEDYWAS